MTEVTLHEITFATVRDIIALEVGEQQRPFVAPNATSIAEAHFNTGAYLRAIYAGEIPVGFVMLFDPTVPGAIARGPVDPSDIGLWRFMIDHRFQRRGYARQALDLVRAYVRQRTRAMRIISSFVPGDQGPETFYLHYGFRRTGRLRANGTEVEIEIVP